MRGGHGGVIMAFDGGIWGTGHCMHAGVEGGGRVDSAAWLLIRPACTGQRVRYRSAAARRAASRHRAEGAGRVQLVGRRPRGQILREETSQKERERERGGQTAQCESISDPPMKAEGFILPISIDTFTRLSINLLRKRSHANSDMKTQTRLQQRLQMNNPINLI